jgi:NADH-quinone oxidoreductase subunit J
MLQIAIYVGAIVVLILFSIMLVRREQGQGIIENTDSGESAVGLWLAGLLALSIAGVVALAGPNLPTEAPAANLPISDLGRTLVLQYPVPLIILALLISAALIGSLILIKVER